MKQNGKMLKVSGVYMTTYCTISYFFNLRNIFEYFIIVK